MGTIYEFTIDQWNVDSEYEKGHTVCDSRDSQIYKWGGGLPERWHPSQGRPWEPISEWSTNATYEKGGAVLVCGSVYRCVRRTKSQPSAEDGPWQRLEIKDWSSDTKYEQDDIVNADGSVYRCSGCSPQGWSPDRPGWIPLGIQGPFRIEAISRPLKLSVPKAFKDWSALASYTTGDQVLCNKDLYYCVEPSTGEMPSVSKSWWRFWPLSVEISDARRQHVTLDPLPSKILWTLAQSVAENGASLIPKEWLMFSAWGDDLHWKGKEDNQLSTYLGAVRNTFGVQCVKTEPRRGVRFTCSVTKLEDEPDREFSRRSAAAQGSNNQASTDSHAIENDPKHQYQDKGTTQLGIHGIVAGGSETGKNLTESGFGPTKSDDVSSADTPGNSVRPRGDLSGRYHENNTNELPSLIKLKQLRRRLVFGTITIAILAVLILLTPRLMLLFRVPNSLARQIISNHFDTLDNEISAGTLDMPGPEALKQATSAMQGTRQGDRVFAIDRGLTFSTWKLGTDKVAQPNCATLEDLPDSPYLIANIKAVERGVQIFRIFITNRKSPCPLVTRIIDYQRDNKICVKEVDPKDAEDSLGKDATYYSGGVLFESMNIVLIETSPGTGGPQTFSWQPYTLNQFAKKFEELAGLQSKHDCRPLPQIKNF